MHREDVSRLRTFPVGLGCAFMVGGLEARKNIGLIHAAFDVGIRHFDTAPNYGMGLSEDVVGEAIKLKRHQVTVATKFGLSRPPYNPVRLIVHNAVQPFRRWLPRTFIHRGRRQANTLTYTSRADMKFTADNLRVSIRESLRRLGTDYLDILFLHEVSVDAISDEFVVLLDNLRESGICRFLGLATSVPRALEIESRYPSFFDVYQYKWSVLEQTTAKFPSPRMIITHRSLMDTLEILLARLRDDIVLARQLSLACERDVRDPSVLADLLVLSAVSSNELGMTLVSSRSRERVQRLGDIANNLALKESARKFAKHIAEADL